MDDPQSQCIGWIQTLFGECKTQVEAWSFMLGNASIFCWLNAQIPQILENFKLRSAASLSLPFLINWLLGDFSNLLGCILTKQLPFQFYLAIYFCIADVILFSQWIYYSRQEHSQVPLTEIIAADVAEVAEPEHPHHHHHHHRRRSSHSHRPRRATSAGILTTRPTDEALEAAEDPNDGIAEQSDEGRQSLIPKRRSRRLTTTSDIAHRKSTSIVLFGFVMLAVRQTLPALQEQGTTELLNHGGSTLRHTASQGRVFARALGDEQMLGDGSNPPSPDLSLIQLGRIFAWICTLFYLSSRMPQLWKNFKRKSVKGLSILMFFWAVMGNLTYTLSILYSATVVNPDTRHKALQEFLPYLLGSSGTLIFDISIFGQWLYYTGRLGVFGLRPKSHRSRHRHRHHHHSRLRSTRSTPNRSRAESMLLSPSGSHNAIYSILVDEDDADADPPHPLESAQIQSMENLTLDETGHESREVE